MTPKQILVNARSMIAQPKYWTKTAYARDSKGRSCDPTQYDAVSFCAIGAIIRGEGGTLGAMSRSRKAACALVRSKLPKGYADILSFNDNTRTTHAAVLKVFDRAIKGAS